MITRTNRLVALVVIASTINILNTPYASPMQQPAQQPAPEEAMRIALERVEAAVGRADHVFGVSNNCVFRANEAMGLAHSANGTSINAFERANEASAQANRASIHANEALAATERAQALPAEVAQAGQDSITNLENEYNRLREGLENAARAHNEQVRENNIQIEAAKINEKHRLGIFEQEERIRAQAVVDAESTKWDKIQKMIDDPKRIAKIVLAITAIALGIYTAKHGIPMLMNYFTQPQVVSETSKSGWFGWGSSQEEIQLSDLVFTSSLQNQLFDLLLRVQSAKTFNENLPNVLFYGAPGTGKTAFAKALAHYSGLNYALTSGSEFAKITDLNIANNELRKLLDWAQGDDKGLIVFIDEAESLFANRKLTTTSKSVQDFINTFLALIPEKSQKNLMFVFATNHPFKLDDAITNRIGINIEFTIPEAPEREKILATYLAKFAQENADAPVTFHPEIFEALSTYVSNLEGLSPRAIKFVAEELIVKARRQEDKQLTNEIAQLVLNEALLSLQQTAQWEKERDKWVNSQMARN